MKPILQALLLADRIYQDKTGKHIIAGTFNKLVFGKGTAKPRIVEIDGEEKQLVPGGMQAGSPSAYISLTDIRGKVKFVLRYVSLKRNQPFFQTEFSIECHDPLKTFELVFPMPTLPLEAGVHALELLWGDEPIGSHRVIVEELEEPKEGDNDDRSSD